MIDEKKLVERCIANDEHAITTLYRLFSPVLFGICMRYARRRTEAEDLLHDGFIRVLDHLRDFRHEGSLEGWMKKIMVTTAINYYRRNHMRSNHEEELRYQVQTTQQATIIDDMSAQEILVLINDLPDGYRIVFNLFAIEGYKHREIAEILGIAESTSKSQYMKARACLIGMLEKVRFGIDIEKK
jgi:RNA polymerase sigma factor (sigma-70 family)